MNGFAELRTCAHAHAHYIYNVVAIVSRILDSQWIRPGFKCHFESCAGIKTIINNITDCLYDLIGHRCNRGLERGHMVVP